jgi:hypothetical protein
MPPPVKKTGSYEVGKTVGYEVKISSVVSGLPNLLTS